MKYLIVIIFLYSCNLKKETKDFSHKKNNILNYDSLMDLNYRFLDENYKILLPKDSFNFALKKYNFYEDRIRNYKDSLLVTLMYELKDVELTNKAHFRIGYTWERLSYHIWSTEKETKNIAHNFGFNHPYKFKNYLIDEKINETKKNNFIKKIRDSIKAKTGKDISLKPYKLFFKEAFRSNPIILEYKRKVQREHK